MGLVSSPRRRRRALRVGVAVAAITLIVLGVHFSNPGDPGNASGPELKEPTQPKKAPFTRRDQQAVRKVLREFVLTAVDRQDVGRSWEISAPSLREGFTKRQWSRGNLPVVPYPAANRGLGRWSFVQYSYRNQVGLEVYLFPKPGSGWSAMSADVELVKGHDGRWRVDYWMPIRFHGPPSVTAASAQAKAKAKAKAARAHANRSRAVARKTAAPPAPEPAVGTPRPSKLWWAVPISLLALIVVAPLTIGLVIWVRNRREARRFART